MERIEQNKIIKELEGSLLYAMSLGSKELYHSNVWVWLFTYNRKFLKIFFKDIMADEFTVTREENNRDITIWVNRDAYVIENKFKSLPNKGQLNKYEKKLAERFKGGVITGIKEPEWIDELEKWHFLSYREIVSAMREVVAAIKDDNRIINEYIDNIEKSIDLIEDFMENIDMNWLIMTDEVRAKLKVLDSVRLADICQKLQANRFVEYIKRQDDFEEYRSQVLNLGWELEVRSDFSNKTGLVDVLCFKYENKPDNNKKERRIIKAIGIQLQSICYKKIMMMNGRASDIYNEAVRIQWISENWSNGRKRASRQKDFRFKQYNQGGGNFFVYHDWKIEECDSKFEKLWTKISGDLKIAIDKISLMRC